MSDKLKHISDSITKSLASIDSLTEKMEQESLSEHVIERGKIAGSIDQEKLKQREARISAKLIDVRKHTEEAIADWIDIGEEILGARIDMPNDREFSRWWRTTAFADEIGPDNRAALITMALNRERSLRLGLHCRSKSPRYMVEEIEDLIEAAGGARPLNRSWRNDVSLCNETSRQDSQPTPAPQNPAPEAPKEAESPEPSCEKKAADDAVAPRTPAQSNAAIVRWGEIGANILRSFSDLRTCTVWNQLTGKRHGIEVAKFALAYFERAHVTMPTKASVHKPNARLVLPWLNSPFADEYDLSKAAGFEKLKADLDVIERICRPVFATRQRDKGNQCFTLFRREMNRPKEEALAARVEALTQRDRKAINVQNHPPIKVYGVELWPDGDLPENLRLSYDAARWAYFLWRDHEAFFTRAEQNVNERGAFWQSRQRSLHDLKFPVGEALSYFWWRCGEAMRKNPEAHMECFCRPVIRVK